MFQVARGLAASPQAAGDDGTKHPRTRISFKGQFISVLILTLLLASSFVVLAKAGEDAQSTAQVSPPSAEAQKAQGHGPWDWKGLADSSGRIDVIIWGDTSLNLKKFTDASKYDKDLRIKVNIAHGSELTVSVTPEALEAVLAADPGLHAYPDLVMQTMDSTSNEAIGAPQVWNKTDTSGHPLIGTGVVVAVVDTGICYTHPDLGGGIGPGHKIIGGYDFYNNDSDPMDDNGHGTHVAGIIAGDGGIHGVAPGASLLAYKALGADGSGSMSYVIKAIDAATDPNGDGNTADHADVISMSLGGSGDSSDPICRAVERATNAGVLVVVAAGNSGPSMGSVASPGVSPFALTVGAVNDEGVLANFSSRGPTDDMMIKPEVSAPGVAVLSTVPFANARRSSATGYMEMSGTSMATPHVSGAAALIIQMHPSWTPVHLKAALISGAKQIDESLWTAGSGMIWLPTSVDVAQYSSTPLISYGVADGIVSTIDVTNTGTAATFSVRSSDWHSLSADGTAEYHDWTNLSGVSPSSITISGTPQQITITINPDSQTEGYYDGLITLTSGSMTYRIPFGFLILSKVTVHVFDIAGREVIDPYGGVWVYSLPDAATAIGRRGSDDPAPPATFLLPAGQYQVHAFGHQLIYNYGTPYILSGVFTVGRLQTLDVNLTMTSAHLTTFDLETSDGLPIYVKEYRVYGRFAGDDILNVSFDLTGTDYSITGSDIFNIPHSVTAYVSDTSAVIGIQVTGYSYTKPMWDFMQMNWQNWYEYASTSSTEFMIEATTDLQFMLAWEFNGVDSTFPSVLTYDLGTCTVLETKYDIPGTIYEPWCNWGSHRAIGGESVFYMRRDTETSLNPFFSGTTRTSIVNGVFSELYFPRGVFQGFLERELYIADYTHVLKAHTASEVYLPNRNFLTESEPVQDTQRIGSGPFYPSVYTASTDSSIVMFHPLLRDQYGSKVDGMAMPTMRLYRDGFQIGIYQLSEYQGRPDAKRIVPLLGAGSYSAKIEYSPFSQLYNDVMIELGFITPATDLDPPVITGMVLSQRFTPGGQLTMDVSAFDVQSPSLTVTMSSRSGYLDSWNTLVVSTVSPGVYRSTIQTPASASVVDVKFRVTDASGNYIEYTANNASWAETPVQFDIAPVNDQVEYKTTGVTVGLTGYLKLANGSPIDDVAGVPLELKVGTKKIGLVLDECMSAGSHSHDGTIAFDWVLKPSEIFTGPGQSATVTVDFDLGTYQRITRSFTLTSIPNSNTPPTIQLVSPPQGSVVSKGTTIDLSITDDGSFTSGYSVDGGAYAPLSSPWDISTSTWSDGVHDLRVYAQDDEGLNATSTLSFDIDALSPLLSIDSPINGSAVPIGSTMSLSASDRHLASVVYSVDGGSDTVLSSPYQASMASWSVGTHTIEAHASDSVGHMSTARATFQIVSSTVTVSLVSPTNQSIMKSGVPIVLSVLGSGALSCSWSESGISHAMSAPFSIDTAGWSEGTHNIVATASNDLGGSYSIAITITIDNTPPTIVLMSPSLGSYVDKLDVVVLSSTDAHYLSTSWTVWGMSYKTTTTTSVVLLSRIDKEGVFTINAEAVDKANNSASKSFVFTMDLSAPVIAFGGADPDSPLVPGAALNVSAVDTYLQTFQLSTDGAASQVISSPFEIDTHALIPGWHLLRAYASDMAGHPAYRNMSIYIDTTPPVVQLDSVSSFVVGSSLSISASVSDDFAVSGVTLCFLDENGGIHHIQMSPSGSGFTATISAGELWDGMQVYAVATDKVGNTAESSHVTLTASDEPVNGTPTARGFLTSVPASATWTLSAVVAALAVPIVVFLVLRRRKDTWETFEEEADAPPSKEHLILKHEDEFAPKFDRLQKMAGSMRPMVSSGLDWPSESHEAPRISEPLSPAPKQPERPSPPVQPVREPVRLIDAIPERTLRARDEDEEEYQAFLHELEDVQKQMQGMCEKRSVYQEPGKVTTPAFVPEFEIDSEKPKRVSGLQMKKSME